MDAPIFSSALRWRSIGRAPIAHPPGRDTRARPRPRDERPQHEHRRAHRLHEVVGGFHRGEPFGLDGDRAARRGTPPRRPGPTTRGPWCGCPAPPARWGGRPAGRLSSAAQTSGSEAFFAPEIRTVPSSGRPPTILILSMFTSLWPESARKVSAARVTARRACGPITTRSMPCRSRRSSGRLESGGREERAPPRRPCPRPTSTARHPPGRRSGSGLGRQAPVDAVRPVRREQRLARLVVADLGLEGRQVGRVHVGRVADDEVEASFQPRQRGRAGPRDGTGRARARPSRARVFARHSSAAADTSIACTAASARSAAIERAMHPLPVPTSAITGEARPASSSSAASTSTSVSGRGINTSGVTRNSCRQNACVPVRCCSGRRRARSATSASSRACVSGGSASCPCDNSAARSQPRTWRTSRSACHAASGTPAAARRSVARRRASSTVVIISGGSLGPVARLSAMALALPPNPPSLPPSRCARRRSRGC